MSLASRLGVLDLGMCLINYSGPIIKKDVMVTAAQVYDMITNSCLDPPRDQHLVRIWHSVFPLKIK